MKSDRAKPKWKDSTVKMGNNRNNRDRKQPPEKDDLVDSILIAETLDNDVLKWKQSGSKQQKQNSCQWPLCWKID